MKSDDQLRDELAEKYGKETGDGEISPCFESRIHAHAYGWDECLKSSPRVRALKDYLRRKCECNFDFLLCDVCAFLKSWESQ